ncbi:uncharacterized protein LOC128386746 [Panonychus citri]|uniref:uncharacterized protein LOC128386746 n=1 Tax=Panonychus citri TaxID=50023 RepID=UPI002307B155|nr:uncharacterized protein LOC128386746 [Panonychus citri]
MLSLYYFALCVSTITIGLSTSSIDYNPISDLYPENYDNYHQSNLNPIKIKPQSSDQQLPWYNKQIIRPIIRYEWGPGLTGLPYMYHPEVQSYRTSSRGSSSSPNGSGSSSSSSSSSSDKSLIDDKRSSVSGGNGIDMIFGKKSEKPFRTWGGKR